MVVIANEDGLIVNLHPHPPPLKNPLQPSIFNIFPPKVIKSLGPARLPPPPPIPPPIRKASGSLGSSDTEYVEEVLLPLGSGLGEKEYRCKVCGKVSKFKGNLVRHMLVHTGERNFSCRYGCGACYKNSWNMKKHEVKCRNNPMVR